MNARSSFSIMGAALFLTMPIPLAARAAAPSLPQRWVIADDVRVWSDPGMEYKVVGTLSRGAKVTQRNMIDGSCFISGDLQHGWGACKYLSVEPIARPKAGENGVDAAQRWISGNAVTLRVAPNRESSVVQRFALNNIVALVRDNVGNGYCEVRTSDDWRGYIACRYLALTPVVLADILGQESPDYDPERAFWLEPGWFALANYAGYLQRRGPKIPQQELWPRDEALERMKAHLALGLKGRKPGAYADWSTLKRKATYLSREARRWQITDNVEWRKWLLQNPGNELESRQRQWLMGNALDELENAVGDWRSQYNEAIHLIQALELPRVRASLFRGEAEIAPPNTTTEDASGRFGIVFRQVVTPRPTPKPGEDIGPGLYDMLARTELLVQPVQRVRLFRDGRLYTEPSFIDRSVWYEAEESGCSDYVYGFKFGDSDASIWRYFSERVLGEGIKSTPNPAGSLFEFYTTIDLPRSRAAHTEISVKMNRETTGFVRGTYLHYDLDGDGVPDLIVWEGQGKGYGHLDGPTTTDDNWYRLVLVNVDGAWKVLGSDEFGYGCGC